MIFKDRASAGKMLAVKLKKFQNDKNTLVLALPRGGVITGFEIAKALNLTLDIIVPRKIGATDNEEYAIGAITETGEGIFNQEAIDSLNITKSYLDKKIAAQKKEALRRLKTYRKNRAPVNIKDKTAIIVDDGIATGLTMRAAIKSIRDKKVAKIIVAVPVIAADSLEIIKKEADEVIYLEAPQYFGAVAAFYENFSQTSDKEVIELLLKTGKYGK